MEVKISAISSILGLYCSAISKKSFLKDMTSFKKKPRHISTIKIGYKKIGLLSVLLFVPTLITLCKDYFYTPKENPIPHAFKEACEVCFTPDPACLSLILKQIDRAKNQVLVQAYSFTDPHIAHALIKAKKRGVDVKVILDKSNRKNKHSKISLISKAKIQTTIDPAQGIAHNKVMIIDGKTVITGSYNFSQNAYTRNVENVLIIHSPEIAKSYTQHWYKRWEMSGGRRKALMDGD